MPTIKLSPEQVRLMRDKRATKNASFKELAAEFGVSLSQAHRICTYSSQLRPKSRR